MIAEATVLLGAKILLCIIFIFIFAILIGKQNVFLCPTLSEKVLEEEARIKNAHGI